MLKTFLFKVACFFLFCVFWTFDALDPAISEAAAAPPERNTNEIELPDDELFDDDDFVIDTTPAKRQKIEENE